MLLLHCQLLPGKGGQIKRQFSSVESQQLEGSPVAGRAGQIQQPTDVAVAQADDNLSLSFSAALLERRKSWLKLKSQLDLPVLLNSMLEF